MPLADRLKQFSIAAGVENADVDLAFLFVNTHASVFTFRKTRSAITQCSIVLFTFSSSGGGVPRQEQRRSQGDVRQIGAALVRPRLVAH